MPRLDREDIKHISSHSDLPSEQIHALLSEFVYNSGRSWKKFLRILFISLSVGFCSAGIIMFFAYNWNALGKFAKISLIELLIAITVAIILLTRLKDDIKNILLTGASLLVGVLFAVFGQIYQTGANAYDFFLGWTISIALWVVVSDFAVLWLLFLVLIQTTFLLYAAQIAVTWSENFISSVLLIINLSSLVISEWYARRRSRVKVPLWFIRVLALAAVGSATIGLTSGIFNEADFFLAFLFIVTALSHGLGIYYGFKTRQSFYLSVISLSIVVIISDLLISIETDAGVFLITFLFVVISITLIIRKLISLQKQWSRE